MEHAPALRVQTAEHASTPLTGTVNKNFASTWTIGAKYAPATMSHLVESPRDLGNQGRLGTHVCAGLWNHLECVAVRGSLLMNADMFLQFFELARSASPNYLNANPEAPNPKSPKLNRSLHLRALQRHRPERGAGVQVDVGSLRYCWI